MKTVKDILMNKSKNIYSVPPTATVFEALKLMGEKEIGAVMVMDGEEAVGIVSERDYARKVILKGKTSRDTLVKEIMTSNMFTVKPGNTVEECMILITGKRIRHVPVFDHGKFVGVISIGDIVKSIISQQETLIEQLSSYIAGKYT